MREDEEKIEAAGDGTAAGEENCICEDERKDSTQGRDSGEGGKGREGDGRLAGRK